MYRSQHNTLFCPPFSNENVKNYKTSMKVKGILKEYYAVETLQVLVFSVQCICKFLPMMSLNIKFSYTD